MSPFDRIARRPRFLTVIVAALLAGACAWKVPTVSLPNDFKEEGVFWNEEGELVYFGALEENNNRAFFEVVEGRPEPPALLVIASQGGTIIHGLEIGRWVHENEVTVRVVGLCASSCANYIFTAAPRRQLYEDSIVAWKGSAWQTSWDERAESGDQVLIEQRQEEAAFFSRIGVDRRISTYGQGKVGSWDRLAAWITGRPIQGFDYSIEDMALFGVTDIELLDGNWDWRRHNRSNNVLRVAVDPEELRP